MFRFTVVTYVLISIVNFLAGIVRPEYHCMSLVSSPKLSEASKCNSHFKCIKADTNADSVILRNYNYRPASSSLDQGGRIRSAFGSLRASYHNLQTLLNKPKFVSKIPILIPRHPVLLISASIETMLCVFVFCPFMVIGTCDSRPLASLDMT